MKALVRLVSALGLVSCAGYHLGSIKPVALRQVNSIAVQMFSNATLHPRAEALATSAVTSAIVADGTYRIASADQADALLDGKLVSIKYSAIRGARYDTLHPEELSNTVTILWQLRDAKQPSRVLASGVATGISQLYVTANLQTARNNALPDALERAGQVAASTLANGY